MKALQPLLMSVYLITLAGSVQAYGEKVSAQNEQANGGAEIDSGQRAWGMPGAASNADRHIAVTMNDTMRFVPEEITVRQGDTVTFSVTNNGRLMHEFVLGTPQNIDQHAVLMKQYANMEHTDEFMTHVSPGGTGEVTWTFNRGGKFLFACLVVGHQESGMAGKIHVEQTEE